MYHISYFFPDELLEELEELSNIIHSKSHQSSASGEIGNAINTEVDNQPSVPSAEGLQILDEHINLPTTLPPAEGINQDQDSIELELFEVGKDKEGNRIYDFDSNSSKHLEKELESLEKDAGGSAFEEESYIEDLGQKLEDADLEKQLDDLSHHHMATTGPGPSLTAVPTDLKPVDSSGGSSSTSGESSSDESGDGSDVGSGDQESFLKEVFESSGDGSRLVEFTEDEGSGVLLKEEGFVPAIEVADSFAKEGSGEGSGIDEISGDGIFVTEEPGKCNHLGIDPMLHATFSGA